MFKMREDNIIKDYENNISLKENSNIAAMIDISSQKARYDESIKHLLADKQILARIMKYTVDEFMDKDIAYIISCMDEPEISRISVEPGITNFGRIVGLSQEDFVPGEGKIVFDIRFNMIDKDTENKILINIEAQKSTSVSKLGYHLDNRIIFYISRMISAQKNIEFVKSNYDDLKPVRSIWICMDGKEDEASITKMVFGKECIFGNMIALPNVDKVQGIIIKLRENESAEKTRNVLIDMLEELLRKDNPNSKKEKLHREYGIMMSEEIEGKVNVMCNLSDIVMERGIEQGIERGKLKTYIFMLKSKINKGKNLEATADEMEQKPEDMERLYYFVKENLLMSDEEMFEKLLSEQLVR